MRNKYYYLISSLPYLFFDTKSPISIEYFLSECRIWITARDGRILQQIDINKKHMHAYHPSIVKKWEDFNNNLKEDLANIRSIKKSHPGEKIHLAIGGAAGGEIFSESNPLLIEKRFERIRWDFLENQEFYYFFDINRLIIYLYKLQILERLASFNKEKGAQVFNELCEITHG